MANRDAESDPQRMAVSKTYCSRVGTLKDKLCIKSWREQGDVGMGYCANVMNAAFRDIRDSVDVIPKTGSYVCFNLHAHLT